MVTYNVSAQEQLLAVLASMSGLVKPRGGVLVLKGVRPFRSGEIVAIDTTTKKAMPRRSTQLSATAADGQAILVVDDTHNFAVGDVITAGDATGTYVIKTIDSVTQMTLTTNLTGGTNPLPVDARIHDATDERNKAKAIALTPMVDAKDTAVAIKDSDGVFGDIAIRGSFIKASIQDINSDAETDFGGEDEINGIYSIK